MTRDRRDRKGGHENSGLSHGYYEEPLIDTRKRKALKKEHAKRNRREYKEERDYE